MFACVVSGRCDVILFVLLSWQCVVFHRLPSDFLVLVRYTSVRRGKVGFMSCSDSELLDLWLVIINFGKFLANYFFLLFKKSKFLWIILFDVDSVFECSGF